MYFVSKTLAEKAAWEAAKEHNIKFISIIPTLVVGPFIMPTMPPSLITALSPITGIHLNKTCTQPNKIVAYTFIQLELNLGHDNH